MKLESAYVDSSLPDERPRNEEHTASRGIEGNAQAGHERILIDERRYPTLEICVTHLRRNGQNMLTSPYGL